MIRRLRPVDRRQFPRPATRGAWAGVEALEGRQLLSTTDPLQAVPLQGLPGGGGGGQADTTPPVATLSTTAKDPSGLFFDVDVIYTDNVAIDTASSGNPSSIGDQDIQVSGPGYLQFATL